MMMMIMMEGIAAKRKTAMDRNGILFIFTNLPGVPFNFGGAHVIMEMIKSTENCAEK